MKELEKSLCLLEVRAECFRYFCQRKSDSKTDSEGDSKGDLESNHCSEQITNKNFQIVLNLIFAEVFHQNEDPAPKLNVLWVIYSNVHKVG